MPKKACCCNQVPPETGSCCRPIYNGCVNRTYEFTFQFTARFPCLQLGNYQSSQYQCINNPSKRFDIPGEFETFEVNVQYTIENPAEIRDAPPAVIRFGNQLIGDLSSNCGNFACQGPNWTPDINSLINWKIGSYTPEGCDCRTSEKYSYCNFDEDKLKNICNCSTGFIPYIYYCPISANFASTYEPSTAPCGRNPFTGLPLPFESISEGNNKLIYVWNGCYNDYQLKQNDTDFNSTGGIGCTFSPGDANIANIQDSYSIQFIPNPSIPEQNSASYIPRLQPDLINFTFECHKDDYLSRKNGYTINMAVGLGYNKSFNCGTANNPVIEIVDIPYRDFSTDSDLGNFVDGLYIQQYYNRESLTTDPFDGCILSSTELYPNGTIGVCEPEPSYLDSYTNKKYGIEFATIGSFGSPYGGFFDPPPNISKYCFENFDSQGNFDDNIYCNYIKFSNKILVNEV